jgi:hypothetical protein
MWPDQHRELAVDLALARIRQPDFTTHPAGQEQKGETTTQNSPSSAQHLWFSQIPQPPPATSKQSTV